MNSYGLHPIYQQIHLYIENKGSIAAATALAIKHLYKK
jgi:hypothetical protein